MTARRSQVLLVGGWLLAVVALAPVLTKPIVAVVLALALVGFGLAWKSIAYPIGLAGVPTVVQALVGSNPLPKGGTTFLLAAWIGGALVILVMRGGGGVGIRGLLSLPVAGAVVMLALMLLRLGASGDQSYGMQKIELYVAGNLLLLVGGVFLGADKRAFRLFLLLTLGVTVVESLFLVEKILSGGSQFYAGRYTVSNQEGPINLGRDSATGVLIAMYLILVSPRGRLRTCAIVALPLCLISLVGAGSRGPIVAFVIGLVTVLSLAAANPQIRRRLATLVAGLAGAAILVPFVVPGSSIGRSLSTIVGSASGLSSNGRSSLWAAAYSQLAHHALFGIGTGGFGSLNLGLPYPHNILLEIGVELGTVGLLAFGVMTGSVAVRMSRLWRWNRGDERMAVSLLIALMVSATLNAFFSGALPDNADIWKWGGIAIGMYASYQLTREPGRRGWV
ncbi:MAG: O-antigen ligase family protein [Solirubrobacteraceae bacterium]